MGVDIEVESSEERVTKLYEMFSKQDRGFLCETVIDDLNLLFALGLSMPESVPEKYDSFIMDLNLAVLRAVEDRDYRFVTCPTKKLIETLASDHDDPISIASDIAEIHFLDRNPPSFGFERFRLEYALKARELDEIFREIAGGYCTPCPELVEGVDCCNENFHEYHIPEEMRRLQKIDAVRNGWSATVDPDNCRYQTSSGCALVIFKSPDCFGYTCESFQNDLRQRYDPDRVDAFLEALEPLRRSYVNNYKVIEDMDAAIEAAEGLSE